MADKFRLLFKGVSNKVNKQQFFDNIKVTVHSATEKAQEKLNDMQNAAATKYDIVAKQINSNTMLLHNLKESKLQPTPLPEKIIKWWHWYQVITGLDKVEVAKQKVIEAQDKLFEYQDKRKQLSHQMQVINNNMKNVYSEIIQTKREDPKYVQLIIMENKILQEQANITSELHLLEAEEKDHFTLLTTTIKEYHDNQTMSAQRYKYLSIIASAIVAVVSLTATVISNNRRIKDIHNSIVKGQANIVNTLDEKHHSLQDSIKTTYAETIGKLLTINNADNDNDKYSTYFTKKQVLTIAVLTIVTAFLLR